MQRTLKRKILKIENIRTTVNGTERVHAMKVVWWGFIESGTKTTYRLSQLSCSVYLDRKFKGTDSRFYSRCISYYSKSGKALSVPKKDFTKATKLDPKTLKRMQQEAFSEAYTRFRSSLKNLKGTVRWFDRIRGEGFIRIPELGTSVVVYACNLKGAKTGFPETACTYLVEGEDVVVDYVHESCGAIIKENTQGIHSDKDQWDSLDQNKLAFKCDDDGNFINDLLG